MFQMVANLADEMSFIVDVIRGTLFAIFGPFCTQRYICNSLRNFRRAKLSALVRLFVTEFVYFMNSLIAVFMFS
jgi:hypothetical protein